MFHQFRAMVTFTDFASAIVTNPVLLVITVLVLGAIFVNGAADASNAIATVIGSHSIKPRTAIVMGAVCNFVGLVVMTWLSTAVADTIGKMADFGSDGEAALLALAASACLLLATLTGIPVSTTHTNTTAVMGSGAARNIKAVQWDVAKNIVLT